MSAADVANGGGADVPRHLPQDYTGAGGEGETPREEPDRAQRYTKPYQAHVDEGNGDVEMNDAGFADNAGGDESPDDEKEDEENRKRLLQEGAENLNAHFTERLDILIKVL